MFLRRARIRIDFMLSYISQIFEQWMYFFLKELSLTAQMSTICFLSSLVLKLAAVELY